MLKKIYLLIGLLVATTSHAQLNTFSEGDVISAEQMNENFESLVNSNLLRSTSVSCDDGETINGAIEIGYNDITVSGTCSENLLFSVWRDSSVDDRTPSGKLAPRYLRLSGADTNAKIMDASSNADSVISVSGGTTLVLEGIIISGGQWGVSAARNSNLLMTGGVTVEGFTERGIQVFDSSYLGVDEGGVTIQGGSSANYGIYLEMGANAWVHTTNISNIKIGVNLFGGSFLYLHDFSINASNSGIRFSKSTVRQYGDGVGLIQGTSESAVDVSVGIFETSSEATFEISNLQGGRIFDFFQSKGTVNNLKVNDFDLTGSGESAISIGMGSAVSLRSIEISGSCDDNFVSVHRGSYADIRGSTIVANSTGRGINVIGGSRLDVRDSTISGTAIDGDLVNIGSGSSAEIRDSTISGTATEGGLVSINGNSGIEIRDSTLTVNGGNRGLNISESSHLTFRNSLISGSAADQLVNISHGSSAGIRDSSITVSSAPKGLVVWENSHLYARNLTISGTTENYLIGIETGANAQFGNSDVSLTSSNVGLYIADGAKLNLSNSKLSGSAPNDLVRITRASSVMIESDSSINQTSAGSNDISVSYLSLLTVDSVESPIKSVNCYNKGYVSADEGSVTDLATSCTE